MLHFRKVIVAADQNKIVLPRDSRNPDIVLRNRPPFHPQLVFDQTVFACRSGVTSQHGNAPHKLFDPRQILFSLAGFAGTVVQLS